MTFTKKTTVYAVIPELTNSKKMDVIEGYVLDDCDETVLIQKKFGTSIHVNKQNVLTTRPAALAIANLENC